MSTQTLQKAPKMVYFYRIPNSGLGVVYNINGIKHRVNEVSQIPPEKFTKTYPAAVFFMGAPESQVEFVCQLQ